MRIPAKGTFTAAIALLLAACAVPALAQDDGGSRCARLWSSLEHFCEGGVQAWSKGKRDLYLTGYAYHGRGTYTRDKIDTFNESMWGAGIGKNHVDERGRTHLIYAMGFQDSHAKPEWIAGYGWLAHTRPAQAGGLKLGAGFTAFVTTRSDYAHYLAPVPGILPMGEIAWNRFSIMATYVPRLSDNKGNGDVLILFGRISF